MTTTANTVDSSVSDWKLQDIVQALRHSREVSHNIRHRGILSEYPSHQAIASILEGLAAALFPTHFGRAHVSAESVDFYVGDVLSRTLASLREQVRKSLLSSSETPDRSAEVSALATWISGEFVQRLPSIRALLVSDLRAAFAGDPAATSV